MLIAAQRHFIKTYFGSTFSPITYMYYKYVITLWCQLYLQVPDSLLSIVGVTLWMKMLQSYWQCGHKSVFSRLHVHFSTVSDANLIRSDYKTRPSEHQGESTDKKKPVRTHKTLVNPVFSLPEQTRVWCDSFCGYSVLQSKRRQRRSGDTWPDNISVEHYVKTVGKT